MGDIPEASKTKIQTSLHNAGDLLKKPTGRENDLISELECFKSECVKSVQHRVFAGSEGAYNILTDVLQKYSKDIKVACAGLNAIISLMDGYPDLLEKRDIGIIMDYLDNQKDEEILKRTLEWTKVCCIKHEQNRQDLVEMQILARLKKMLNKDSPPGIVRQICGVARALVLDDDIRVPYGKSHEHARQLAAETLCILTDLLKRFKGDKETVSDIIQTLSSLTVRNEFCQKVEEAGGLKFIKDVFNQYPDSEKLNRQLMKLVKALVGNDDVKEKACNEGIPAIVIQSMRKHEGSAALAAWGMQTVAAMSLRSPCNGKAFYDAGAPDVVLQLMKTHPKDAPVQKQGSWAIRNIVSRNKSFGAAFLKVGAEEVLKKAIKVHGSKVDYDAKTALRELGIKID